MRQPAIETLTVEYEAMILMDWPAFPERERALAAAESRRD
jgi:hypothetical protein